MVDEYLDLRQPVVSFRLFSIGYNNVIPNSVKDLESAILELNQ